MVPDITTEKLTVHMIKVMPFIPIECIFTQVMPLFQVEYHRRFTDFVNGDEEFFTDYKSRTPFDIGLANYPDNELCFQLPKQDIQKKVDFTGDINSII